MTETTRCPRCGAILAGPGAPCPACLLRFAARPESAEDSAARDEAPALDAPARGPIAPPSAEEVARALPAFEQIELIGEGGMGSVFRARETALQRSVAIKVLPRSLGADAAFKERFLREARALARLVHPSIVTVHGFGEADGLCYLVMELVEGANLRALMREQRIEPRQALAIVAGLCDALQYAHDEGVVHRDIKPENVLVDRAGRVKIADFGLAKLVGVAGQDAHLTRSDQVMGTPHYMAPEQLERPRDVDHRADLFALGVVLYEMLTGSLPRGAFELPSRRVAVDVRLDEIVLKALERDPSRRYQHALEVKTDVERVQRGPEGPATRAATPVPTRGGAEAARTAPEEETPILSRGFLWCLGFWIVCGAVWSLGSFAFGACGALYCLLIALLAPVATSTEPELPEGRAGARLHMFQRRSWLMPLVALLSFVAFAVGHLSVWERGTTYWAPAHHRGGDPVDLWRADPWILARLCDLDLPGDSVLDVGQASYSSSPAVGEPSALSPWWLIGAGVLFLVLALRAGADTLRRRGAPHVPWGATFVPASQVFGALVLLWVFAPILALRSEVTLGSVERAFSTPLAIEAAAARLAPILDEAKLARSDEQRVFLMDARTGQALADAQVLAASVRSPFQRWETTWSGPRRKSPRAWITLAESPGNGRTNVQVRLGLYEPGSPEASRARDFALRVESALTAE